MRYGGLLFTAWLSLSACHPGAADQAADQAAAQEPVVSLRLPTPTGPFGVGRTLRYWTDATRQRELPVWVYYPTARPATPAAADSVLPAAAWAQRYHAQLTRRLGAGAATALLGLRTTAQRQAPVAPAAQALPVLLFAPGLNWLPTDYSALLEELASQGYVVVAWAPPQYAGVVQLRNGQLLEGSGLHEHGPLVADFRFVRRQLDELNAAPDSPVRGRLNLSRVGAVGHSIGGTAAVGAAQAGALLGAVANLDGDFDEAETTGRLAQPVLYLTSEPPGLDGQPVETWEQQDRSEARRQRVWAQLQAPAPAAYRVRLPGFYHSNFQDAALLPPAAVPAKLRQHRFGRVDGAQGLRLTAELLTAFFDAELRGHAAEALPQVAQRHPAIRLEVRR
ncbi:hypothetical protein LJ737_24125 [Hymenobacter sp. 15J16-1T3B]|uniref:alpha/beta hydrolase n=1 Tax=Hymenobacter sp. 15J16-1T3B TaxID=2886941 RepID=UPI001D116C13|nr:hypothetical protein [Hymenobacter sp. 15J16-1T3B]MCC3160345.1 hypothetical protein [Hymenobacter sp. 15J16-1T3B]